MTPRLMLTLLGSLLILEACAAAPNLNEDACTMAEREVTLQNLLQSSLASAYERCLYGLRETAAEELGRQ